MLDKLAEKEQRYEELERLMADPEIAGDYSRLEEVIKEHGAIRHVVNLSREYRKVIADLGEARVLAREETDREMASLAREEMEKLAQQKTETEDDLRIACHFQANHDDVMKLPLTGGARVSPQRSWSLNYFRSLRVFHGLGERIKAGYGGFDVANVQSLLADKALVDTSNSMNAVVFEPSKLRLHSAMGSVPATDSTFEVFTLEAAQ